MMTGRETRHETFFRCLSTDVWRSFEAVSWALFAFLVGVRLRFGLWHDNQYQDASRITDAPGSIYHYRGAAST